MAIYNVLVTSIDGISQNVAVDANSISEARRKAESQSGYGARASGVPELAASPVGSNSFSSFVGGIDSNFDPSAYGIQNPNVNIPNPVSADLNNQLVYANSQANTGSNTPQYNSPYGEQYDPASNAFYTANNQNLSTPDPISADLANQLFYGNSQASTGANTPQYNSPYGEQYDPYGGTGFDPNEIESYYLNLLQPTSPGNLPAPANAGQTPYSYNPVGSAGYEFIGGDVYDPISSDLGNQLAFANSQANQGFKSAAQIDAEEIERFRQDSLSNPVVGDLSNQLDFANSQAYGTDNLNAIELATAERERIASKNRENKEKADALKKEAELVFGPVRSWDAKLGDITVNPDGSVNLPTDMWRNAYGGKLDRVGRGDPSRQPNQPIGKEQIEDAIRRIAELGGRDTLSRSVENMLQQARTYYSNTPRGDNTWDKNIEGGLIPEADRKGAKSAQKSFLNDSAWQATWGSFADEVLGARETDVTGQIPDAWANNPDGYNSLSEIQKEAADVNNLTSMSEVEAHYTAEQAKKDAESVIANAEVIGPPKNNNGETGLGMDDLLPKWEAPSGSSMGDIEAAGGLAGTGNEDLFIAGASQGFKPPAPPAFAGAPEQVYTSQELMLDPITEAAGQRLAFRNVYGDAATNVGPLSSYLQRQSFPLADAYRGSSWANMAREGTGGVAPQVSFEDFLRTTRNQPSGLSGTYGQTLQDVNYLRGLGGSQVPVGLEGVFNPEQAANTRDARNLLQAAQKGKYSGLVSRAFRRPSEDDLFSDYVLARQDASTAGTAPQNFLNFAASRYGL